MEQIEPNTEVLQTNPGPLSDIEDGEIPNLEDRCSPTLNKKTKKKSKRKNSEAKRKELENIDFNSSDSEKPNSPEDSDDGWWSKKKHRLNDEEATRFHEKLEDMEKIPSVGWKFGQHKGEKKHFGKNLKLKGNDVKRSPSPGSSNDEKQLYPCKSYIAYGKCTDTNCRCVHAPLTREDEIRRFIDENEDFFLQVFKKFPEITLPPPLMKALTAKFGPHSSQVPHPPANISPQNHILRPMPPPKLFPPQGPYPIPPAMNSPMAGFPPHGLPQQQPMQPMQPMHPMHPFPNMFPPLGMNVGPALRGPPMFPGQPMFNGTPLNAPMQDFRVANHQAQVVNMGPHGSARGPFYFGSPHGHNGEGMIVQNNEYKGVDIHIKYPEKISPSKQGQEISPGKRKGKEYKSPEGNGSSRSSPSITTKDVAEVLEKLKKRNSAEEKMNDNNGKGEEKGNSTTDFQSQETDSATPESKEESKKTSTVEKIARLVELFKAKQINKPKETEVAQKLKEDVKSPVEKLKTIPVVVVDDLIYKEEPKIVDSREESEDEALDSKVKVVEEKPVVNSHKEEVQMETENKPKEEKEEVGKKSIYENGSVNEALLRQLKSALPLNQAQAGGSIKDLVNMYLKLGKNPLLQSNIQL